MEERVLLGRISGAHGLRGEVKIATFTSDPSAIAAYGPLHTHDSSRVFHIGAVRVAGAAVIAHLRGVESRTAAEALKGVELYVLRNELPPAPDGEFYHSDLVAMSVVSEDGIKAGEILGVRNFGAGDLLEIQFDDPGRSTKLVPFDEAHVPHIDIDKKTITVSRALVLEGDNGGEDA